jgi:hypothetical protein
MTINKFRNILYKTAKYSGDINAVRKGKIARRIGIRIAGKATGRLLGRIFR